MFTSNTFSLINNSKTLDLLYRSDDEIRLKKLNSEYVWLLYATDADEILVMRYSEDEGADNSENMQIVGRIYDLNIALSVIAAC